jgi:hypothetical protein
VFLECREGTYAIRLCQFATFFSEKSEKISQVSKNFAPSHDSSDPSQDLRLSRRCAPASASREQTVRFTLFFKFLNFSAVS